MGNIIEVVGLGSGDINQLPLGIYKKLKEAKSVFVRTLDHPVLETLQADGLTFHSFDTYYEKEDQFAQVYEKIVQTLLKEGKEQSLIYAVPGHPMLAEQTVQLLLKQTAVKVEILGGQSYLDDLFTSLKIDPIDGFQFIDGTLFTRSELNYENHIIFCQVYNKLIASEIKLVLLEDLPANYEITIVEMVGSEQELITKVPLKELDHNFPTSNLLSLYIPPVDQELLNHTFHRLQTVISTLRGPGGCEWDKRQTHKTLRKYAIEEVFELIEAIDKEDDEAIIEELGDVLLQVMLHSQIGEDNGYFSIDDVILNITNKMIHRHPHVFNRDSVDVHKSWDELKLEEKRAGKSTVDSFLDNVPTTLPPLTKAVALQKKAAKVGFDWDNVADVWDKLEEELTELAAAIKEDDEQHIEEEFGDVLFVMANLSRFYKLNPDIALNKTNKKFTSRFQFIEQRLGEQNKELGSVSLEEMDIYWNEAKGEE